MQVIIQQIPAPTAAEHERVAAVQPSLARYETTQSKPPEVEYDCIRRTTYSASSQAL